MKKLFVLVALMVSAVSSQAAYLWWQIENPTVEEGKSWATANIYARNIKTGDKGDSLGTLDNIGGGYSALDWAGVTDKGADYGYYIELMSSDNKLVGYTSNSSEMTYTALVNQGMITASLDVVPTAVWHGGTISAPEPTSAMLMLLGVAGLSLRRKQRKIA